MQIKDLDYSYRKGFIELSKQQKEDLEKGISGNKAVLVKKKAERK